MQMSARSIRVMPSSIGPSTSAFRSESAARATTGPSSRRTWCTYRPRSRSRWARPSNHLPGRSTPTIGARSHGRRCVRRRGVAQQEPVDGDERKRVGRSRPSRYRGAHDEYPRSHAARFAVSALVRPGITEPGLRYHGSPGVSAGPRRSDGSLRSSSLARPTADDTVAGGPPTETAQRRPPRAAAPPAPPARTWAPVALSVAPASASSSGGGGGGGLAVALSLPFVLALLYSGFRRLRTSGSVPSAHIDREPERPG